MCGGEGGPYNQTPGNTSLKELCSWHLGGLSKVTAGRFPLESEQFPASGTPRILCRERLALPELLLATTAGGAGVGAAEGGHLRV